MLNHLFTAVSSRIAGIAGKPVTFVLAVAFIVVWGVTGPLFDFSDTWQLVVNTATTIVTFLMVFLIQNSQNRDAAAMQAKLDEIIRTLGEARNRFIGIEHRTDTEVEDIRDALEKETDNDERRTSTSATIGELLKR